MEHRTYESLAFWAQARKERLEAEKLEAPFELAENASAPEGIIEIVPHLEEWEAA